MTNYAAERVFSELDDALAFIARVEFYENWTIARMPDGRYAADRDYGQLPEEIEWTYARALSYSAGRVEEVEDSGLFEPCETWSGAWPSRQAGYVRRALPGAVEALESGAAAVTFGLEVVSASDPVDYCTCADAVEDSDGIEDCQCDRLVGWVALARIHGADDTAEYVSLMGGAS